MRFRKYVALLLLSFLAQLLGAQDFYVTNIQIQDSDSGPFLSWEEPGFDGVYYNIYRSEEFISANTYDKLEYVGTVEPFVEYYMLDPNTDKFYYYGVFMQFDNDEYYIPIPLNNVTTVPRKGEERESAAFTTETISKVIYDKDKTVADDGEQEIPGLEILGPLKRSATPFEKAPIPNTPYPHQVSAYPLRNSYFDSSPSVKPRLTVLDEEASLYPDDRRTVLLQTIVGGYLYSGDWKAADIALQEFLRINHSSRSHLYRARFYRGQALYHLGDIDKAYVEFLVASKAYPGESRQWLDIITQKMSESQFPY